MASAPHYACTDITVPEHGGTSGGAGERASRLGLARLSCDSHSFRLVDHHPTAVVLLAGVAVCQFAPSPDEDFLGVGSTAIAVVIAIVIAHDEGSIEPGPRIAPRILRSRKATIEAVVIGAINKVAVFAIEAPGESGPRRPAEDHAGHRRVSPSARGDITYETAEDRS
jgi:hypothetical protein